MYFQILRLISVWKSSAECYMFISSTSLLKATGYWTDPASQRLCTLEAETILHEGGRMMQSCQLYIKITPKLQRADGC